MGTSFINFHDKGFWIRDVRVCPLIGMISEHIMKTQTESWLIEYALELKYEAKCYSSGFTSLMLDEHLDSDDKRLKMISILNRFKVDRLSGNNIISVSELNQYVDTKGIGFEWDEPLETEYYRRMVERIIDSLNGIGYDPGDGKESYFK